MGFLNKAKASLSNAGNYTSQKADEASFNSKISEQKKLKTEAIEGAGQKMFDLYMHGTYAIDDEIKELFEKVLNIGSTQHFAVVDGDCRAELEAFASIMGFEFYNIK